MGKRLDHWRKRREFKRNLKREKSNPLGNHVLQIMKDADLARGYTRYCHQSRLTTSWDSQDFSLVDGAVISPLIEGEQQYWTALHEIGHWFHTVESTFQEYGETPVVESEAQAWEWAKEHSMIPMSDEIKAWIEATLDTYRFLPEQLTVDQNVIVREYMPELYPEAEKYHRRVLDLDTTYSK